MDLVDPHMHLWSMETHRWLVKCVGGSHLAGDFKDVVTYLVDDYAKDALSFGVKKCVHVQAHHNDEPIGETRWLQGIADSSPHGFPHGIVAYCNLSAENADEILTEHCKFPNVRGIRQMLDYHPEREAWRQAPHDKFMEDPAWLAGLSLLQKHNLSFDMQIHVTQMQTATSVIRQNPNVQFIINHGGFPGDLGDEAIRSWKEGLSALAQHSNVAIKLSGYNMFHHDWNKELLKPLIEYPINTFKVDRCMFASNFPVDKINSAYSDLMSTYRTIAQESGLSSDDITALFRDNATKFYRL